MSEYISLVALIVVVLCLAGGIVVISALIGGRFPSVAKEMPYECGVDPAPVNRGPLSIKFYLIAILFLLFDVEVVLLYPWAALYRELSEMGLGLFVMKEAFVFVAILSFGLLYVLKRGALEWEK
jgi:NADH-quinone oxidoreductase subunit A